MLAQRTAQQSLRKLALQQPSAFSRGILGRISAPALLTAASRSQKRLAATEAVKQSEGYEILASQRLHRPVAPHLGIYQPQITWLLSSWNRITGSVLSGAFYVFGFGYLVMPYLGFHVFESSSMVAAVAGMSVYTKVPLKFLAASFFTFHCFNGVRHLVWDTGRQFKNQQVIRTGWAVVGLTIISSLGLALM